MGEIKSDHEMLITMLGKLDELIEDVKTINKRIKVLFGKDSCRDRSLLC